MNMWDAPYMLVGYAHHGNKTATEVKLAQDAWAEHLVRMGLFGARMPSAPPPWVETPPTRLQPIQMIRSRLRLGEGEALGLDHLHAHEDKDMTFVFVVHMGKHVVLEDERTLFPSDQLITSLRLLRG